MNVTIEDSENPNKRTTLMIIPSGSTTAEQSRSKGSSHKGSKKKSSKASHSGSSSSSGGQIALRENSYFALERKIDTLCSGEQLAPARRTVNDSTPSQRNTDSSNQNNETSSSGNNDTSSTNYNSVTVTSNNNDDTSTTDEKKDSSNQDQTETEITGDGAHTVATTIYTKTVNESIELETITSSRVNEEDTSITNGTPTESQNPTLTGRIIRPLPALLDETEESISSLYTHHPSDLKPYDEQEIDKNFAKLATYVNSKKKKSEGEDNQDNQDNKKRKKDDKVEEQEVVVQKEGVQRKDSGKDKNSKSSSKKKKNRAKAKDMNTEEKKNDLKDDTNKKQTDEEDNKEKEKGDTKKEEPTTHNTIPKTESATPRMTNVSTSEEEEKEEEIANKKNGFKSLFFNRKRNDGDVGGSGLSNEEEEEEEETANKKQGFKSLFFNRKRNDIDAGGNGLSSGSGLLSSSSLLSCNFDEAMNARESSSKPIFFLWTFLTERILHTIIKKSTAFIGTNAARYPHMHLLVLTLAPLIVLAAGYFTNFTLIVDSDQIYTPMNSFAMQHGNWLVNDSGFNTIRPLLMIIHMNGANVLGKEPLERLFQAVDLVRETDGYDDLCEEGTYYFGEDKDHTCRILSATRFWNHNTTLFHEEVTSDAVATRVMSQPEFRDGTPAFHEMMLGNYEMGTRSFEYRAATNTVTYRNHTDQPVLHFVQSYAVRIELPDVGEVADDFENRALDRLKEMKQAWEEDDSTDMVLDFLSIYAYKVENQRALIEDLPLVLGIFAVLLVFTTLVFSKPHPIYSRSMLGIASLLAIGMSLCLAYGIVWCIGIPFTNIAQILPFMIMGVGLDDTFIITGEYFRTNPNHSIEKRVETTMKEVGLSITLTTATTMVAFVLGSLSTIPGVQWLCWYAFSAMGCAYFFQITYFIALLSLDERRLQDYRLNVCCWKTAPVDMDDCESQMGIVINSSLDTRSTENDADGKDKQPTKLIKGKPYTQTVHFSDRFMTWYGRQLMRIWVKIPVLLGFLAYTIFCSYRMTLLTQEFNVEDYTPADSYLRGTLQSLDSYYSLTKPLEVYFRGVDQSDPEIQQQMRDYVNELANLTQIGEDAPFCWVRDLETIGEQFPDYNATMEVAQQLNLTFGQQVGLIMGSYHTVREIYGEDIVIDEDTGEITASRCLLFLRNLDLTVVEDQVDFLESQREVTKRQPINQNQQELKFFSFDNIFYYWELYAQAVDELMFTIVSGVIAVSGVTFILIPHWSAIFFVCPGITILYVNFLGTMQLMGLHINSLTYVIICMAIGLLVDFLVHIMLRYYETRGASRDEKVKETLRTMGASICVGGVTTCLGVCPLVFSSTHIFLTVFWSFLAIVILGFTHGLILLPVVLSLIGPISTQHDKSDTLKFASSTATSSAGKYDDEILRSCSEEELEGLNDEAKSPQQQRKVPFMGPSYDLEAISEAPDNSTVNGPSIIHAPSDEVSLRYPRRGHQNNTFLGQFEDFFSCAAPQFDFSLYDTFMGIGPEAPKVKPHRLLCTKNRPDSPPAIPQLVDASTRPQSPTGSAGKRPGAPTGFIEDKEKRPRSPSGKSAEGASTRPQSPTGSAGKRPGAPTGFIGDKEKRPRSPSGRSAKGVR